MKRLFLLLGLLSFLTLFVTAQGKDGYIKIKDGVIHYKKYGTGKPILIINGGPGMNCEGFGSLAELLAPNHTVILYDQRGTGQSTLTKTDSTTVTMQLMARDIEILRKQLQIDKWVVLGQSFGGIMAQYYASQRPQAIKGLILSASGGINLKVFDYIGANMILRLSQAERDSLKYWNQRIESGDTTYHAKYQRAKYLAPEYLFDRKYVPLLAERLTQGKKEITELVYQDLYKINYNCKESLRNFRQPVLIIQGRQDIMGDGTSYEAHRVLQNSQLVFINRCGHYGWIEQKEQYITALNRFLKSINW
jgi:proline iminopeptidase